MGVEAIKGAGMAYQAAPTAEPKVSPRMETEIVQEPIAPNTQPIKNTEASSQQKGYQEDSPEKQASTTNAQIQKAVEDINKKAYNSEAIFGIHEETNRITIKIVDRSTKEVIKELPPEKTLDMIAKVWEMAGLLVDEKRQEEECYGNASIWN